MLERNTATNYFDSVEGYAVDHSIGTNVIATLDGHILTYTSPVPPSSITDITNGTPLDVTGALSTSLASDTGSSYISGTSGHTLTVDFGNVIAPNAKLIVQGENAPDLGCPTACPKAPIGVQVETKGGWVPAGYVFLRVGGSIEGLDLTQYLKSGQSHLRVKIAYLGGEKVSFIGLDTSTNAPVSISPLSLIQAIYGSRDVTSLLTSNEGKYLVFGPLKAFKATFAAEGPPPLDTIRDIMIVATGHYIVPLTNSNLTTVQGAAASQSNAQYWLRLSPLPQVLSWPRELINDFKFLGAGICVALFPLNWQLRKLRRVFTELVHQDVKEAEQPYKVTG